MTAVANAAPTTPRSTPGWSKEAVLTLVGVCVAIFGILIGLVTSPKAKRWLWSSFTYFSNSRRTIAQGQHPGAGHQLRDLYEEYMRFREFRELYMQMQTHHSE
ncbi:hypothetical protein COCCADRAFT_21740 [Bipolaris zeicola 26-R-13]|uniref:Uncharacterized protein n=1 Tax=Cochliobolus carbonum (strain 26-R-13) TaxID=930089 RepID=W6YUA1_COCC2|nr:uncharacterized protein COCCADRAFT_21740 [Bipolaris zeicola 26-R-13]EUC39009.1 hypothetical protein COCCADRAFT_21740 [Bipolaris zeicola 26-R-13]